MKHLTILLVAALLIILAGCSEKSETVAPAGTQVTELAKIPTPWKGRMEGITVHYPNPSVCGTTMMYSDMNLVGNMTLGGKSVVVTHHCIGNNIITNGEMELTTANGDKIFATYEGDYTILPTGMMGLTAEMTITGGTGRFEGATGYGSGFGESNPSANPITLWMEMEGGYILKD